MRKKMRDFGQAVSTLDSPVSLLHGNVPSCLIWRVLTNMEVSAEGTVL